MTPELRYKDHLRATLALGLPITGSHLAQFAVHLVDTVMLGWYGVTPLAAGVLGNGFYFLFFLFGGGFGIALMPLVAAAVARGEDRDVRRVTRMSLWLSLIFAALTMPLMYLATPILAGLGQEAPLAALAGDYLAIAGWGLFPALGVMVLKNYLSALERAGVVLWVTLGAVVLNAGLNYVLIFGHFGAPEMGVRGAALASVIVEAASFLAIALIATRLRPEHALFARFWRPDWEAFSRVLRLGLPIGVTILAEAGLFIGAAVLVGWIGTIELAAHGIALQIASLTFMVQLGIGNAATIRAGQAHGRGDPVALRRGALAALTLSGAFVLVTIAAFLMIPEPLIAPFLDPDAPARAQVVAVGTALLAMAALFQLADAGQVLTIGLLRGLQDTRVPMWIAIFSYWGIGMPAALIIGFPLGGGVVGVWGGLTVGLVVAWGLLALRFWRRYLSPRAPVPTAT